MERKQVLKGILLIIVLFSFGCDFEITEPTYRNGMYHGSWYGNHVDSTYTNDFVKVNIKHEITADGESITGNGTFIYFGEKYTFSIENAVVNKDLELYFLMEFKNINSASGIYESDAWTSWRVKDQEFYLVSLGLPGTYLLQK